MINLRRQFGKIRNGLNFTPLGKYGWIVHLRVYRGVIRVRYYSKAFRNKRFFHLNKKIPITFEPGILPRFSSYMRGNSI